MASAESIGSVDGGGGSFLDFFLLVVGLGSVGLGGGNGLSVVGGGGCWCFGRLVTLVVGVGIVDGVGVGV